jgi:hypothetical protein
MPPNTNNGGTTLDCKHLVPVGDNVLMKLSPRVQKEGLIHLPDNVELSVWHSGTVVRTGPGLPDKRGVRHGSQLRPGQEAVFRFCSTDGKHMNDWHSFQDDDGSKWLLVREPFIEFAMEPSDAQ